MTYRCDNCEDKGWVCEFHPQHPWPKCKCGGAGMWCPECRPTTEEPEDENEVENA